MSSIASKGLTRDVERGRWSGKQDGLKKKREAICKLKRVGTSGDEKDSEEDEGGGRGQEGWGQNYKQDMATANGFSPV